MFSKLKRRIRNVFITGLLITLPIALTYFVLNFLFKTLDALSPTFTELLIKMGAPIPEGYQIPGLGAIMTLLVIFIVGVFATNIFGRRLVHLGETILAKIPFVRRIYSGTKQIITTVTNADVKDFSKVVLIEFPRRGAHAIAFVTSETQGEVQERVPEKVVNIFVPTTPNPTSGFLIFAPPEEVTELSWTIEEGLKYVVSGGVVVPHHDQDKLGGLKPVPELKDLQDIKDIKV